MTERERVGQREWERERESDREREREIKENELAFASETNAKLLNVIWHLIEFLKENGSGTWCTIHHHFIGVCVWVFLEQRIEFGTQAYVYLTRIFYLWRRLFC
jgi:hypothetical protein